MEQDRKDDRPSGSGEAPEPSKKQALEEAQEQAAEERKEGGYQ